MHIPEPTESPEKQARRLPPPVPGSPRITKSVISSSTSTTLGSNNPFRTAVLSRESDSGSSQRSTSALASAPDYADAGSPSSEMAPAMGDLTMSQNARSNEAGQQEYRPPNYPHPSAQGKPVAVRNLVQSSPPPSSISGGKLHINRTPDRPGSSSMARLQPSYASSVQANITTGGPSRLPQTEVPAQKLLPNTDLDIVDIQARPIPPPYIEGSHASTTVAEGHGPSGTRTDHIEEVDPFNGAGRSSDGDIHMEDQAQIEDIRDSQIWDSLGDIDNSVEESCNQGAVMFWPCSMDDWENARRRYNKRLTEAINADTTLHSYKPWPSLSAQPGYVHSTPDERWENPIGPGISGRRIAMQGPKPHSGHRISGILVSENEFEKDPHRKRITTELMEGFFNGEAYAWWYCHSCCVWFRLGVDYLPDNGLSMVLGHNATQEDMPKDLNKDDFFRGPNVRLAEKLKHKADKLCSSHDQEHHFHRVPDLFQVPLPLGSVPEPIARGSYPALTAEWTGIDRNPTFSLERCCQCHLAVYYDERPAMPACFPKRLLTKLHQRPPRPGHNADDEYRTVLATLLKLVTDEILGSIEVDTEAHTRTEPALNSAECAEPHVPSDMIRLVGEDGIGLEMLQRIGIRPKRSATNKSVYSFAQRWEDRAWIIRAWVELQLLGHELELHTSTSAANFVQIIERDTIIDAFNRASLRAMRFGKEPTHVLPRWTCSKRSNRPCDPHIAQITAELGCCWDDDCEEIVDAFLAQSNCDPGQALRYGKILRDLGNVLKSHECVELQSILRSKWPEADYILSPIERYERVVDVVVDFFSVPTNDVTLYEGRRPALLERFSEQVEWEICDMADSRLEGLQLESARMDLLDTVKRVALTLLNPDLMALDADLEQKFFGLERAAKRYGAEKPSEVAAEGWLALYTVATLDAQTEHAKKLVIDDFTLIANRLNIGELKRELGIHEGPPAIIAKPVPAGLHNIGNTCYLNSLLQYLNTIEEFRDAIIGLSTVQYEAAIDAALPRVGGRLLSRAEIRRAQEFVQELANLFLTLGSTSDPAVVPEKQLAYLALVTSTDEDSQTAADQSSGLRPMINASPDLSKPLSEEPAVLDTSSTGDSSVVESVLGKRTNQERESAEKDEIVNRQHTPSTDKSDARVIKAIPGSRSGSRSLSQEPEGENLPRSPSKGLPKLAEEGTSTDTVAMDVDESALAVTPSHEPTLAPLTQNSLSAPPPLPARPHRASINNDMMFGRQHDISECLDNVLFQVEAVAVTSAGKDVNAINNNVVKRLFFGQSHQRLVHVINGVEGQRPEDEPQNLPFNSIYLSVREEASSSLYEKLQEVYFGVDEVEVDDKILHKVVELQTAPPILQIQLERAQFDRETAKPYKCNAFVKFEETLYMDRFLPTADVAKRVRSQQLTRDVVKAREKLASMRDPKPRPVAETMKCLIDVLARLDDEFDTQGLQGTLRVQSEKIERSILALETNIAEMTTELEAIWSEQKEYAYELSSVFMHRGQAGFGHYWLYQRNLPDEPEQYLKFNDEQVTRVDSHEVLGDASGSNANPYLLVYVRRGATGIRTFTRTDPDSASGNLAAVDQQLQSASTAMDVDPDPTSVKELVPSAPEGDSIPTDYAAINTTVQEK